ncbi:hypothetical protein DSCA_10180 [Desulfosarcina alkanivorans]|uniref:Uncharacterized protein n=2 Tax=Desulfosarcina alkanivorans TaxID=571177 RepID=A0A5K7YD64_9BACT|nr:hypothetical protein DSCA_10180 [Desulfosarcina alkanivorans]
MVSIDPDKTILNITEGNPSARRSNVKKGEFDSIFRKAVDSTSTGGAGAVSAQPVSELRPARFTTAPPPSAGQVVDRVQRLIDTMEAYQQQLIEKGATLKDIQPLVDRMASEKDALSGISTSLEGQESLRTIVNQSLMLSSMEIAKFNGGHYNNG